MFSFITKELIYKFFKFGIVGSIGVLVDFGITYICKELLKIPKYIANSFGFVIAATTNYFFNRLWTFESHNPNISSEFFKFFIIATLGLGINTFIIWFLTKKFKSNFYFSKAVATLVVMIWNFTANLIYTFNQ